MAFVLSSISGNLISAASAGFAPTNGADVSAIASAYAADKQDASAMSAYALSSDVSSVIDTVSANSASWAGGGVDSATVSAIASAYVESGVSGKQDAITYGYSNNKISSIDGSGIYVPKQTQVVTSLQYATSESATVIDSTTGATAGYAARTMSAYYAGGQSWGSYIDSIPLIKVRVTDSGTIRNDSSFPLHLYMMPYGATNNGNIMSSGDIWDYGLSHYGQFLDGAADCKIADGTASAVDAYTVEILFDVTSLPFNTNKGPAMWGTSFGDVLDESEGAKPVFGILGLYNNRFADIYNSELVFDFGSSVAVSSVSGINQLGIYTTGGGGGADTSAVSAIASSYAASAVSSVNHTVGIYSSRWNDAVQFSAFTGNNGIVSGLVSGYGLQTSVSSFMGIDSALKVTTGVLDTAQDTASATADVGYNSTVTVSGFTYDPVRLYYYDINGSLNNAMLYMYSTSTLDHVSGTITACSLYSPGFDFGCTYTAMAPEALAFQSDLTGAGVDSATVSAIASSYAESAVSAVSGDYYSTSNPSGFIDSAYVDSAVSSYALSADVSGTVDLVSTQSANWGGSALALSAGPGVKLEKSGNVLVASTDSTVLWSGTGTTAGTITVSEPISSFERYEIHGYEGERGGSFINTYEYNALPFTYSSTISNPSDSNGPYAVSVNMFCAGAAGWCQTFFGCRCHWNTAFNQLTIDRNAAAYVPNDAGNYVGITQYLRISKIVGINRTAEA